MNSLAEKKREKKNSEYKRVVITTLQKKLANTKELLSQL